jgi:hypothetical protein
MVYWYGRSGAGTSILSDGSLMVVGGWVSYGTNLKDTWISTDRGHTWTQTSTTAGWVTDGAPRLLALLDGSVLYFYASTVWRTTDKGAHWVQQTASSGYTSSGMSVVLNNGHVVCNGSGGNDVWVSTDQGVNWAQQTAAAGWSASSYNAMVVNKSDGSLLLTGSISDTWISIDEGVNWTRQSATAIWTARYGYNLVSLSDGTIILSGGSIGGSTWYNDVYKTTDNGVTWTLVAASSLWITRMNHVVATYGSDNLILGFGTRTIESFNDVYISVDKGSTWIAVNLASVTTDSATPDQRIITVVATAIDDTTRSYPILVRGAVCASGAITPYVESGDRRTYETGSFASGNYTAIISGLARGAQWTVRSYVEDAYGVYYYGSTATVSTTAPIVTLSGVSAVTTSSMDVQGSVTLLSGFINSTKIGACYCVTASGLPFSYLYKSGSFGSTTISSQIIGLISSTYYCVGVYVENEGEMFHSVLVPVSTLLPASDAGTSLYSRLLASWEDTNYPLTSNKIWVQDIDQTTGVSSALYLVLQDLNTSGYILVEGQLVHSSVTSSMCDITSAVSGTIYNIGGVSSEPTNHLVITMWGVNAYTDSYSDDE